MGVLLEKALISVKVGTSMAVCNKLTIQYLLNLLVIPSDEGASVVYGSNDILENELRMDQN